MKTNFSTKAGYTLARLLAQHIARTERISNRDECIDELRELVCEYSDRQAHAPVSAFIKAEDMHRLKKRATNERYYVAIQEELADCAG